LVLLSKKGEENVAFWSLVELIAIGLTFYFLLFTLTNQFSPSAFARKMALKDISLSATALSFADSGSYFHYKMKFPDKISAKTKEDFSSAVKSWRGLLVVVPKSFSEDNQVFYTQRKMPFISEAGFSNPMVTIESEDGSLSDVFLDFYIRITESEETVFSKD